MKKTAKLTAITLVIVLALSCFSVAFAEDTIFEEIFGINKEGYLLHEVKTFFGGLGENLKKGDLKKSMEIIEDQAELNYQRMYNGDENVGIPQIKSHGRVLFFNLNKANKYAYPYFSIGLDEMKIMNLPVENPILNKLEEWSIVPLTWALDGMGNLMHWDKK